MDLIYIAKKLKEALRLESVLTESGVEYAVDAARAPLFYAAIRQYWPGLPAGGLVPDYAGLRPRISAPGEPLADFRIDDARLHGMPQVLNLFGIESPGLTASLAVASEAVSRIG